MPFLIEWVRDCDESTTDQLVTTPAGPILVSRCGDVICRTAWPTAEQIFTQFDPGGGDDVIAGKIRIYGHDPCADIPVKLLRQGSPFQFRVWLELVKIPFGATLTYKDLASRVGSAARAVGGACRANPFPLIIPCHRVVSTSGIGGYAGQTQGDLMSIKHKLLEYEKSGAQP